MLLYVLLLPILVVYMDLCSECVAIVIIWAICTSDCRLSNITMSSFASFVLWWDRFMSDPLSCVQWWYHPVADPYRDDFNFQSVILRSILDWPSMCQRDLIWWQVQLLFASLAILQWPYFPPLVWRSCELLRANVLCNSPFGTWLHSSLYCASPSCLSLFLSLQLRNVFHSATSIASWLPSLYFAVILPFFLFFQV